MTAFRNLRALAQLDTSRVTMERIDLVELLAAYDATQGSAKSGTKYTAEFEEAWSLYPSRPGASKAATFKAWSARLKAGATAQEMIEGTAKYAAFVKSERTEAAYIKQPATFYGPGEHFTADWTPAPRRAPQQQLTVQQQNERNSAEARRLLGFRDLETQGSIL